MNLTTLLGLGKPTAAEDYDIEVHNTNSDKIDAAISGDRTRLTNLEKYRTGRTVVVNSASGLATIPHSLGVKPTVVIGVAETGPGADPVVATVWMGSLTDENLTFTVWNVSNGSRYTNANVGIHWYCR